MAVYRKTMCIDCGHAGGEFLKAGGVITEMECGKRGGRRGITAPACRDFKPLGGDARAVRKEK